MTTTQNGCQDRVVQSDAIASEREGAPDNSWNPGNTCATEKALLIGY
jgi:hypothetical protein